MSEISYPPIGIVYSHGANPRFANMVDITGWSQYGFSVKKDFVLKLPQFKVSTDHPLGFGNPEDVEKWVSKHHVIRILAQP